MEKTLKEGLETLGLSLPEERQEKLCAFARAMLRQNEVMNLNREASLMDIEKLANLSGAGTENGTPGDTPGGTTNPGDKKDEENKNPGGTGSEGTGSEGTGSEGSGSDSGHVNL